MARPSNFAGVTEAFASFLFVTAPLRNSRVPTLPAGRLKAAYDVPPSATNKASQRNGVVADEGEGLEHWTGVSLLGAGGAPAWAEGSVFSKCGSAAA